MPRAKQFQMSKPCFRTSDTAYTNEAGELLPCRRCRLATPPLRGLAKVAVVLDNVLIDIGGGKMAWDIRKVVGPDGDPTLALKEVTLATENYHRECENAYARARRQSRSTRYTVMLSRLEQDVALLHKQLDEIKQLTLARPSQPTYTPPAPQKATHRPDPSPGHIDPITGRFVKGNYGLPDNSHIMSRMNTASGSDAGMRKILGLEPDLEASLREVDQKIMEQLNIPPPPTEEEAEAINKQIREWMVEKSDILLKLGRKP